MLARISAVTGALLLASLVPAVAEAAVIDPLKPCYVTANSPTGPQQEGIALHASGFTPNSLVNLVIDNQSPAGAQNLQTDQTGSITLQPETVPAPFIPSGSKEFSLSLTEVGTNPPNTVSATSKTTALGVDLKPKTAKPSRTIRFKGNGFTGSAPVYAHYLYKGKFRKTVRMARETTDCGGWTSHRRQIPVRDAKIGRWTVQFDQSKRFRDARNPDSGLQSVFVLIIIRVTGGVRR